MKTPNKRIKSKFHHRGIYTKIGKTNKPTTKGAFGQSKKPKIEVWEMPDEPQAKHLPKCRICGLATSEKDAYGNPLCEFCKEDYKRGKGAIE